MEEDYFVSGPDDTRERRLGDEAPPHPGPVNGHRMADPAGNAMLGRYIE
jgi:hypothetical protein